MSGQDGGPWRGTNVHIIDEFIYHLIGEVKWANPRLIKQLFQRGCMRRTPWLQGVTKWSGTTVLCLWHIQDLQAISKWNTYQLGLLAPILWPWRMDQEPDGLDKDLSEDNLGGEAEESSGQITGTPNKGGAAEKSEHKTVITEWIWQTRDDNWSQVPRGTRSRNRMIQPSWIFSKATEWISAFLVTL